MRRYNMAVSGNHNISRRFRASFPEGRRLGPEEEFIAVRRSDGRALDRHESAYLVRFVGERLGLKPNESRSVWSCNDFTFSTDVGSGTWEIAFRPARSIKEAAELVALTRKVSEIAESQGALLLGLGIQPVSMPGWEQLMPSERYQEFAARYSTHNVLEKPLVDLLLIVMTASHQVHVEVPRGEAARTVTDFNLVAPELIAIGANSGVVNGTAVEESSYREPLWDSVVSLEEDMGRRGMPLRKFSSIADYAKTVDSFKSIFKPNGNPYLGYGCVWWGSRLKPDIGTVEVRSMDQQPNLESLISSTALIYGLALNSDGLHRHVAGRSMRAAGRARIDAAAKGLRASIDGEPIASRIRDLLEVSAMGLELAGEDPSVLAVLSARLDAMRNPSDDAKEIVSGKGMAALLDARRI